MFKIILRLCRMIEFSGTVLHVFQYFEKCLFYVFKATYQVKFMYTFVEHDGKLFRPFVEQITNKRAIDGGGENEN